MARCDTCGNEYDKPMEITLQGQAHVFDSFECAIHLLAPECAHCGCKVIGHGIEANGTFFCCAHCAEFGGVRQVSDRIEAIACRMKCSEISNGGNHAREGNA